MAGARRVVQFGMTRLSGSPGVSRRTFNPSRTESQRKSSRIGLAGWLVREVSESPWFQVPLVVFFADANCSGCAGNFADARDGDAVDSLRQARNVFRGDCEEQLKVFAAVQCKRQWVQRATTAQLDDIWIDGDLS